MLGRSLRHNGRLRSAKPETGPGEAGAVPLSPKASVFFTGGRKALPSSDRHETCHEGSAAPRPFSGASCALTCTDAATLEEMTHEATTATAEGRPGLLEVADRVGGMGVAQPEPVELTGVLVRDVLALTGLTAGELASAVGRTERSVRGWVAAARQPEASETILRQLRTISLRLVGGLGAVGVRRWLLAGDPSPLQLVGRGEAARVLADTERLLDSPAT